MLGSRGMREGGHQQGWITKLVFNPPLALRDVDNALGPITTVPTRLSTPRLLSPLLLFRSIHAVHTVPTLLLSLVKGTPLRGGLSTQHPDKPRRKR